ncbi:hypothetical protein CB1_002756005 [Camelus ferus]|nr:hypothetical protein CB1_002756005 [Camelus ferus]
MEWKAHLSVTNPKKKKSFSKEKLVGQISPSENPYGLPLGQNKVSFHQANLSLIIPCCEWLSRKGGSRPKGVRDEGRVGAKSESNTPRFPRKPGCRCYCSPLGSGESLSLSSKRAKKAGLPGLHKKRQQPPTAPLQALRGHNTREQLLCPPKRQLSYHLGGRGKGGRGEKCTRSR